MKRIKLLLSISGGLLIAVATQAHHSFVIYDGNDYITLKGVFTADRFAAGTHANFDIQVTGPDGEVVTRKVESQANRLWPEDRLNFIETADIGQEITVTGWPMRNGTPTLWLHTMAGDQTGRSLAVNNRIVQGASQFTFGEGELFPEEADDLPEFTPEGRRTRTEDGLLTRFGARLMEERSGKSFDERQEFE